MMVRFGSALLILALFVAVGCSKPEAGSGTASSNASAPAAAKATKAADRVAILGMWDVVGVEDSGKVVQTDALKGSTMEFTADKMTLLQSAGAKPRVMTYKLDEAKKHIDTSLVSKAHDNVGIYELKGDDLRLCMNDDESSKVYPTEFKSGDKKLLLMTLRRAKK